MPGYKGTLDTEDFAGRMKMYESGTSGRLLPLVPVIARLDGKSFHTFCHGLDKPFDPRFKQCMADTAKWLVHETNALAGYVQSDEITLMWHSDDPASQKVFFDRRLQKMVSVLAAMATARFNRLMDIAIPGKINPDSPPVFDCRVWVVPNKDEAANAFLWRTEDAKTNSIQAVGQANFSHKRLLGMKNPEIIEDLKEEKHIDWHGLAPDLKFGTLYQRRTVERPFTSEEIEYLPAKHEARTNPNLMVARQTIFEYCLDFMAVANRVKFLFEGADPIAEVPR